jgi:hypothetical protein
MESNLDSNNIVIYYEIATDFVLILQKLAGDDLPKNNSLKSYLDSFIIKITDDLNRFDDHLLKKKAAYFKFMLAKVLKIIFLENKSFNPSDVYKQLEDSLKLSKNVLSRFRELRNESAVKEEKFFLSEICFEIGHYYETIEPQIDFAEKAYSEALNNSPENEK